MSRERPAVLMCRPDHFGIEYEINPWMHVEKNADRALAIRQWEALVGLLEKAGAKVELMASAAGLPDMVFTANAGVVWHDVFVPSVFRHEERQGEQPHFGKWFRERGWKIEHLPSGAAFEGAGDALFCGRTLFAGYLHRSEIESHAELGEIFGCETLSLELVDPRFYHLDTCFCPLAPGVALYYPGAFDEYGRRVLEANVPKLLAVPEADAVRFACNAVVIGRTVTHNAGCPWLEAVLTEHGFVSQSTPLDEFLKAGGSAKCLTLRLDGEEAAEWSVP
ncbi:MAG TPA: arginine deiminase-related protein [Planctomycetia bacterium]|nr:arginine deiminase-related protein [Planctomycetia bacterium]